ncbi:MAG: hypothetical protein D6815_04535 [Candidatus Dadabacteria bacterium]|nr:MAG: hypothetical protein D6815_04535 [Candidatus Dadabacteria bacterium]
MNTRDEGIDSRDLTARPAREDPAATLRRSLEELEAKLGRPDGWEGLSAWLDQVEQALAAIDTARIDATRSEIRLLIDELLDLNARVQNLLRLKRLLS